MTFIRHLINIILLCGLVPAGPIVPVPNIPLAQFNLHLTFSIKSEF